jgi:hypothetical protein
MWLFIFGGAGVYLCRLDVLYDLEHGIYAMSHGGASELGINLATGAVSIGALTAGWRFRHELLGDSPAASLGDQSPPRSRPHLNPP